MGWALIAVGAWVVAANAAETRPVNFGVFFLGLLIVHDLVIAPATLLVGLHLRERAPRLARGAIAGALVASVVVVALVVPAAIGRGAKLADNPTITPRDPWASAALVVAVVWAIAAVVAWRRLAGRARGGSGE